MANHLIKHPMGYNLGTDHPQPQKLPIPMTKYLLSLLLLVVCTASITAQKPKLMLPIGHTSLVEFSQFSPDEKKGCDYFF